MTQAVIYARVSSKEQAVEGYSIDAQLKLLREYAATQGLKVAEEFVEVETAKRAGRTQFGAMIDFLRRRRRTCKTILVEKTDRLYRNFRDYVTLDDLDLEVHFVKEGFTLSEEAQSTQKFMHTIKVALAKHYIDNLSEETRKGMTEKAAQGTWPSYAPIGYVNVGDNGHRKVALDPERAPLVRQVFEWYAQGGTSISEVHGKAVEAGLRTRAGKPIARSMIGTLLGNAFYTGRFVWKGREYPGDHDALVSLDLFQRVQAELRHDGKPLVMPKRVFAYGGLVRCAHCGCSVTAEMKKGKYVYYHCTGGRGPCDRPYIREEALEEKLGELVRAVTIPPEAVEMIVTALRDSHRDEREFHAATVERLQDEAKRMQARLDALYEDKLDGKITEDFWARKNAEYRAKQLEALAAVERHQTANHLYLDEGARILDLARRAYDLWAQQPQSGKRELLNLLLSNCTWDGENLCATYRKPFCWLAEGPSRPNWLPAPDSNQEPTG